MNFGHMIGQHHYESLADKLTHIVTSWTGFVATIVVGGIICYVVYKRIHKTTSKEKIKK